VVQDRPVVPFSSWLNDTASTYARNKVLQVLTPATSRITFGLSTFLFGPTGRWVVRAEDSIMCA
jgi:hypothetical protein